jgi:DNA replication and repair protein RecF
VRLAWIEIRDFRNHRDTALEVSAGLTAVVGPNAQGKTNLLEAMYYLCALESPRVSADLPLVRSGATSSFLRGEVEAADGRFLVEVEVRGAGQNRVQVNRSPVRRRRDLRRHIRAVFSGPDDLAMVQGDPAERRRFMDEAVRSLWPLKEGVAGAYERVLRQRNRLLKDWDGAAEPPGMAAWDEELVAQGSALMELRVEAVARLRLLASGEFETLSGDPLVVEYQPSVEAAVGEELDAAFRRRLVERRGDELIRRTTLVGPHRDDLRLVVQGLTARGFASHGEVWGSALCLRLAQARAIQAEVGEPPILFLDDPFSGLDPERRDRLGRTLDDRGQVLLAVPDDAQVPERSVVWRVKEGGVVVE